MIKRIIAEGDEDPAVTGEGDLWPTNEEIQDMLRLVMQVFPVQTEEDSGLYDMLAYLKDNSDLPSDVVHLPPISHYSRGVFFSVFRTKFRLTSKALDMDTGIEAAGLSFYSQPTTGGYREYDKRKHHRTTTISLLLREQENPALLEARLMPPMVEEKPSYGGTSVITSDLRTRLNISGISWDQYDKMHKALKRKLTALQKLFDKYDRDGGDGEDLTHFSAAAEAWRKKWSTGEAMGKAKNVVVVDPAYTVPSGTVFRVGFVLNTSAYRKKLFGKTVPWYFGKGLNGFKLVIKNLETGEVKIGSGYEAMSYETPEDLRDIANAAVKELNDTIIAPWRRALGYEEKQYYP